LIDVRAACLLVGRRLGDMAGIDDEGDRPTDVNGNNAEYFAAASEVKSS